MKVGIKFNPERRVIRTLDCHRIMEWSKSQTLDSNDPLNVLQDELMEEMFKAYFEEAKDLSLPNELLKVLEKFPNLDKTKAEELLKEGNTTFTNEIHKKDDVAKNGGVSGVPFFIIGEGRKKVQFSGAQPVETFEDVLEDILG